MKKAKTIDAFKCIKCGDFFSGTEVGSTTEFPYACPPRLEVTCKKCTNLGACEPVELSESQIKEVKERLKMSNLKPKFTPGPWVIETYHGSFFKICKPDFKMGDEVAHRFKADAALIAAAPEMFEALERALDLLEEVLPLNTHNNINHAHAELSAVLKKARGES